MTYERACETLKLNPNRTREQNAKTAASMAKAATPGSPLRFAVAADVIINPEKWAKRFK